MMFSSFFNGQSKTRLLTQVLNGATFLLALTDYCRNPNAQFSETGFNLAVTGLNFYVLRNQDENLGMLCLALFNVIRVGCSYSQMNSRDPDVSPEVSAISLATNLLSLGPLLFSGDEKIGPRVVMGP